MFFDPEPPSEAEIEAQFQKVGTFTYVPLTLPTEPVPPVLTEKVWPEDDTSPEGAE